MKELLHFMVCSLVDNKDAVTIRQVDGQKSTVLEVKVADEDKGKVIGKGGRTAQAIRTVVKGIAAKENKKVIIEII
ncbi:MAG: KH domain-containing protein [Clostridia bacterium]|nr:KH domain-containing protein [Clostridia bacterium]